MQNKVSALRVMGRRFFPMYEAHDGDEEEVDEEPCIIPNEPIYVITRNCPERARSPSIILSTSSCSVHARSNLWGKAIAYIPRLLRMQSAYHLPHDF